jgi:hypothetical protein
MMKIGPNSMLFERNSPARQSGSQKCLECLELAKVAKVRKMGEIPDLYCRPIGG